MLVDEELIYWNLLECSFVYTWIRIKRKKKKRKKRERVGIWVRWTRRVSAYAAEERSCKRTRDYGRSTIVGGFCSRVLHFQLRIEIKLDRLGAVDVDKSRSSAFQCKNSRRNNWIEIHEESRLSGSNLLQVSRKKEKKKTFWTSLIRCKTLKIRRWGQGSPMEENYSNNFGKISNFFADKISLLVCRLTTNNFQRARKKKIRKSRSGYGADKERARKIREDACKRCQVGGWTSKILATSGTCRSKGTKRVLGARTVPRERWKARFERPGWWFNQQKQDQPAGCVGGARERGSIWITDRLETSTWEINKEIRR